VKNLIRGLLLGVILIPVTIIFLALVGTFSILLFIGLVRYVKNDIEKDGLKNAKRTDKRFSSRPRFSSWLRGLVKDS
jgi:hypothetical protein